MVLQRPIRLEPGDSIRIVAPASHFDKKAFLSGVDVIRKAGFQVHYRDDIFAKEGYFAGSDRRRHEELEEAIVDEECKAIFCARGGYGITRILPNLDKAVIRSKPKIFVGYSDLSAMLAFLVFECGQTAVHGPLVVEATALGQLWRHLTTADAQEIQLDGEVVVAGEAEGMLFGGNLAVLQATVGLSWFPKDSRLLLFIEDVNELDYRIDRSLTHLQQVGLFKQLCGVIIGKLGSGDSHWEHQIVKEFFGHLGIPMIYNCGIGHYASRIPIPVGVKGMLDTKRKLLVAESPVS